jgi:TolA-binding protein
VKSYRSLALLGFAAALMPAAALAQRQAASPDQRIERLERQVEQMQRQVFPRGRPADTAGLAGEPAATQSSVATLDQRLDAVERQMADMLRQSEENGHRLQTIDADLGKLRSDQEQRITALEQRMAQPVVPSVPETTEPAAKPPVTKPGTTKPTTTKPPKTNSTTTLVPTATSSDVPTAAGDPAEDAYTEGFKQWEAGNFDQAITSLRTFTAAYPKHRRVSYANNLIGRSLLSKGQARPAAEAFLTNYRANPGGERAPDSLFYLGQSLMQLGQPAQACKAYQELDAVYGAKIRPDLKKLEADAKTQAQCS